MIRLYGTSHISKDSLDVIDEAFEDEPDVVALELDARRLEALMFDGVGAEKNSVFITLMEKMQNYLGKKTGLMPGQEMLYAYNSAIRENMDVALVDQNIQITVSNLKEVRRKEKFRAVLSILSSFMLPFGKELDISEIPDEDEIQDLLSELEESFPQIYQVLMTERNFVMAERLENLQLENPEADIAVFMGAAHRKPVRDILESDGFEVGRESLMEEN